jgi:tetratricopeptide (TPR) repeat protein
MHVARAIAVSLLLGLPSAGLAQPGKEPPRPKLAAGADTNDARAYYDFAMPLLSKNPKTAADALYWATRIEPMWADGHYARYIALMLIDPGRIMASWSDAKMRQQVLAIDSVMYRAISLNPFVSQRLDRKLFDAALEEMALRLARGRTNSGNIRYQLELAAEQLPPGLRAKRAHADSLHDQALVLYSRAIEKDTSSVGLRVDRAKLLFEMNRLEGALFDLTGAMAQIRKREDSTVVRLYQSRAVVEHSIAIVHQKLGNTPEAKAAFGRALQEDLSYYPAHLQLSVIALAENDTATALSELDLATQLRADDAGAQYLHGFMLVRASRAGAAEAKLKKAIELNPVYAAPKFLYARLLESADYQEEAVAAYKAFLGAASRVDPRRAEAESRLAALTKPPVSFGAKR